MSRVHGAKKWVRRHKKEVIIAGAGVAVAVGVVVVARNPGIITKTRVGVKGAIRMKSGAKCLVESKKNIVQTLKNPVTSGRVIDIESAAKGLKGNRLTATELGKKAGNMSGREINRRLVNAGLAGRLPSGEPYVTEMGKTFGEIIVRTRPWGYDAHVCGWDEKVLDLIFSKEEWAEIARRNEYIAQVARELTKEAV